MAYSSKLTYPIYDNNASLFLEVLRELLEVEMLNQRTTHSKTFLPQTVKRDEYLLNPIADKEIDPSFCSIIKAKMEGTEQRFSNQQNDLNHYIIGVLADGLTNLRKICDTIYIILNDMDVKHYLFLYKNAENENLISDSGQYYVKNFSTDYEVSKTMNDKNIVYGYLILQAEISEVPKINTYDEIDSIDITNKFGTDEKEVNQLTSY